MKNARRGTGIIPACPRNNHSDDDNEEDRRVAGPSSAFSDGKRPLQFSNHDSSLAMRADKGIRPNVTESTSYRDDQRPCWNAASLDCLARAEVLAPFRCVDAVKRYARVAPVAHMSPSITAATCPQRRVTSKTPLARRDDGLHRESAELFTPLRRADGSPRASNPQLGFPSDGA
jgi:hypothetical protein